MRMRGEGYTYQNTAETLRNSRKLYVGTQGKVQELLSVSEYRSSKSSQIVSQFIDWLVSLKRLELQTGKHTLDTFDLFFVLNEQAKNNRAYVLAVSALLTESVRKMFYKQALGRLLTCYGKVPHTLVSDQDLTLSILFASFQQSEKEVHTFVKQAFRQSLNNDRPCEEVFALILDTCIAGLIYSNLNY